MFKEKLQKAFENNALIGIYYGTWNLDQCRVLHVSAETVEVECIWATEQDFCERRYLIKIEAIIALKSELSKVKLENLVVA